MFKSQPTFHFILLKTMDRLVDRDEAMTSVPLHPNQQAYQAGKSVETVLHQLVVWVEKVLDQQQTALGVFLDIEGVFNPLNPKLNPICYLLALLGAHHFLHVSRIRLKSLNLRRLMSYIHGAPILDVSRSHTTTHHSR